MKRVKAFTLIELLVVISIIALLISILLPALSQARQTAKDLQCSSLQRQMLIGWTAYAGDNNGTIMYSYHGWSGPLPNWSQQTWWVYLMEPYLATQWSGGGADSAWLKNMTCDTAGPIDEARNSAGWIGMNEQLDAFSTAWPLRPLPKISSFRQPSDTVVFTDSVNHTYNSLWGANTFTYRHGGMKTSNFAMADGHVEQAVAKAPNGLDSATPAGVVDAYPPSKFYYQADAETQGWPGMDYSKYE